MRTLDPKTLHFGSLFGALFRLGYKSENGAPVETGTLLRPSGQTLFGSHFSLLFQYSEKVTKTHTREA